jgi:hypothetical protein
MAGEVDCRMSRVEVTAERLRVCKDTDQGFRCLEIELDDQTLGYLVRELLDVYDKRERQRRCQSKRA